MQNIEHAVVIAGGGPTGMMLAAELALAKVDVAVVERRPDHVLAGSRAGGFHPHDRGARSARRRRSVPRRGPDVPRPCRSARRVLDMSDLPTRHPYIARDLAERDRADHGRVDRRAAGAHLLRTRGDGLRAGRRRGRRRAGGRRVAARAVPRRMRRRAEPDPQGRRASSSPAGTRRGAT